MIIYYVLDVETNGLKVAYHNVNQISVLRLDDNKQITSNIAIEHPERSSMQALEVQGITLADLRKGISKREAVEEVHEFLESDGKTPDYRCIVGHNVSFDKRFVQQMWADVGRVFPADMWLCTKDFAKAYAKKFGTTKIAEAQNEKKAKFGLNNLMHGLGLIAKTGAHTAEVDVLNTATLLKFLWDSKVDYVSLIKRIPAVAEKKDVEFVDFE